MRGEDEETAGLGLFLLGAIVGAGLAVLLAPESGEDSRKRLGHWLEAHHLVGAGGLLAKFKDALGVPHNGVHAVNGRTRDRRRDGGVA